MDKFIQKKLALKSEKNEPLGINGTKCVNKKANVLICIKFFFINIILKF